jgi:hypothetical protein
MIISNLDLFSDGQAITASAASTNTLDLGDAGRVVGEAADLTYDLGKGSPIGIRIQVTEAFATLTSLKVAVQTDAADSFGTAATPIESEAIAAADLVAGYVFGIEHFPLRTNERYVRLYYTVAGSNATAGKITAWVVRGKQTN